MSSTERIAEVVLPQIKKRANQGDKPNVVVSALGKTTDLSVYAAEQSLEEKPEEAFRIIESIREQHYSALADLIKDPEERQLSQECVDAQLRRMSDIAEGITMIHEFTPTVRDKILAIGEQLSACVITGALNSAGYEAIMIDLSNLFKEEEINKSSGDTQILERIRERLEALPESAIPVITGFIGGYKGGIIDTIGRGYSGVTAAYVATAGNAEKLEMWTDTEGFIFDTSNVSYDEMTEMAQSGAWKLNPHSIEISKHAGIPLHLRNVKNPEGEGLLVSNTEEKTDALFKAVTVKRGVTILSIQTPRMMDSVGYLERVCSVFSRHGVSIDFEMTSKVNISLIVNQKPEKLEALISDLGKLGDVKAINGKSTLSIVGRELQHSASAIGKIFMALAEQQIPIDAFSMSDNSIVLSLVIEDQYLDKAIASLNKIK